jgi:hypothetical protein
MTAHPRETGTTVTDVTYNPDHYDYTGPVENDPTSELPLELDAEPVQVSTPVSSELGGSLADALRAEVGKRTTPTFTTRVPGREGWSMQFRLDWSETQSAQWEKVAKDSSRENGLNASKMFRQTIADQCIALLKNGQPVPGLGERPFKSQSLQRDFGVKSATAAVEKWLPIFSTQLLPVANAITRAAQQDSLLDPTDPD